VELFGRDAARFRPALELDVSALSNLKRFSSELEILLSNPVFLLGSTLFAEKLGAFSARPLPLSSPAKLPQTDVRRLSAKDGVKR